MRRFHAPRLTANSTVGLDDRQSHHIRDVLRLETGDKVELFDDEGRCAEATLIIAPNQVSATIESLTERIAGAVDLTIASALPKSDRADWLIEKLSELGVHRFIPLQTERSTVHPQGTNKFDRWRRIATESAKQSHRAGLLTIDPLTPLPSLLSSTSTNAYYLSPQPNAPPLSSISLPSLTLLIGPEGGWTDSELQLFHSHNISALRLTSTILRIETAAIAAAAVALS